MVGDENAPTYERVVSPYGHKKHLLGSFNTADLLPPRTRLDSHVEQPIIVPMLSSPESEAGSFIFDNGDQSVEQTTERTSTQDEPGSYDLKAPPPAVPLSNAERLALSLFSVEHLNLILRDQTLAHSFAVFLNTYRPRLDSVLVRYQEAQKAIAALKYANALTENAFCDVLDIGPEAASLGPEFEAEFQRVTDELVSEGLSAYVSHKLVQIVTECLVKEVTGNQMPHMQGLASGVAETYCMTDPNLPDNPIVYASEGFYLTTQYGRDYVIGRNCRFLQGPQTSNDTVRRLKESLNDGVETCETVLNYRRDGDPFLNLLMMAPLHDNRGQVRYFIGCQVDVSGLIDGGKGLESFARLLAQQDAEAKGSEEDAGKESRAMHALRHLGSYLNPEETNAVTKPVTNDRASDAGSVSGSIHSVARPSALPRRRYVGMDESVERNMYSSPTLGRAGRLPGVYRNFLLVRPFPSLRITFTSPALRIPGLVQTRLLDRIGGGSHLRDSICDAFAQGVGVTAKVPWLTHSNEYGTVEGKPRWLHATPMYGSDDKIGVWMVVMVENESITGGLEPPNGISFTPSPRSLLPLGRSPGPPPAMDAPGRSKHRHGGGSNTPSANSDLYANYLHRERPHRGDLRAEQPQSKQATAQSQREHIRQEQARREATLHEKAAQALARHDQAISQANSPKPNSNFDQLHREHREQDHRSRSPETSRTAPPSKDPETSNRREREASRTRKWAAHLKGTLDRRGGVESPVEEREHEQKSMRRSESVRTPQEATHTKND